MELMQKTEGQAAIQAKYAGLFAALESAWANSFALMAIGAKIGAGKNQFRVEDATPWDVALFKISNSTTYTIALTEIDYHQVVAGQLVIRMKKDWGEYQIAERMMGRNVQ
jgi:hypothetical protein